MRNYITLSKLISRKIYFLIFVILVGCSTTSKSFKNNSAFVVSLDTLKVFDQMKQRSIPIAIYRPKGEKKSKNQKIIILNHDYEQNKSGDHLAYSYLTNSLASKGYCIVRVQPALATDSLSLTEISKAVKHPHREGGSDNIFLVINELKKTNPKLNFSHITLIGHSNSSDITVLFPQKYPNVVDNIITWTTKEWLYQELIIQNLFVAL